MSNLTPIRGAQQQQQQQRDEFILQATAGHLDQDEFIQMKREMEMHAKR
jgi:hypothetical protein